MSVFFENSLAKNLHSSETFQLEVELRASDLKTSQSSSKRTGREFEENLKKIRKAQARGEVGFRRPFRRKQKGEQASNEKWLNSSKSLSKSLRLKCKFFSVKVKFAEHLRQEIRLIFEAVCDEFRFSVLSDIQFRRLLTTETNSKTNKCFKIIVTLNLLYLKEIVRFARFTWVSDGITWCSFNALHW